MSIPTLKILAPKPGVYTNENPQPDGAAGELKAHVNITDSIGSHVCEATAIIFDGATVTPYGGSDYSTAVVKMVGGGTSPVPLDVFKVPNYAELSVIDSTHPGGDGFCSTYLFALKAGTSVMFTQPSGSTAYPNRVRCVGKFSPYAGAAGSGTEFDPNIQYTAQTDGFLRLTVYDPGLYAGDCIRLYVGGNTVGFPVYRSNGLGKGAGINVNGTASVNYLQVQGAGVTVGITGATATLNIPGAITPPSPIEYHAGNNLGLTVSGNTFYVLDDLSVNSIAATASITGATITGNTVIGENISGGIIECNGMTVGTEGLLSLGPAAFTDVYASSVHAETGAALVKAGTVSADVYDGLPATAPYYNNLAVMDGTPYPDQAKGPGITYTLRIPKGVDLYYEIAGDSNSMQVSAKFVEDVTYHFYRIGTQSFGATQNEGWARVTVWDNGTSDGSCLRLYIGQARYKLYKTFRVTKASGTGVVEGTNGLTLASDISVNSLTATTSISGGTLTGNRVYGTVLAGTTITGDTVTAALVTGTTVIHGTTVSGTYGHFGEQGIYSSGPISGNTVQAILIDGATVHGTTITCDSVIRGGTLHSELTDATVISGSTYMGLPPETLVIGGYTAERLNVTGGGAWITYNSEQSTALLHLPAQPVPVVYTAGKNISITPSNAIQTAETMSVTTLTATTSVSGATLSGTVISGSTYYGLPDCSIQINSRESKSLNITGGWATTSYSSGVTTLNIPTPPTPPSPIVYYAGNNIGLSGTTFYVLNDINLNSVEATTTISGSTLTGTLVTGTTVYGDSVNAGLGGLQVRGQASFTTINANALNVTTGTGTITGSSVTATVISGTTYKGLPACHISVQGTTVKQVNFVGGTITFSGNTATVYMPTPDTPLQYYAGTNTDLTGTTFSASVQVEGTSSGTTVQARKLTFGDNLTVTDTQIGSTQFYQSEVKLNKDIRVDTLFSTYSIQGGTLTATGTVSGSRVQGSTVHGTLVSASTVYADSYSNLPNSDYYEGVNTDLTGRAFNASLQFTAGTASTVYKLRKLSAGDGLHAVFTSITGTSFYNAVIELDDYVSVKTLNAPVINGAVITGSTSVTGDLISGTYITGTSISGTVITASDTVSAATVNASVYSGLPDFSILIDGYTSTHLNVTGGWATVSHTGSTSTINIPAPPTPPSPIVYYAGKNLGLTVSGNTFYVLDDLEVNNITASSEIDCSILSGATVSGTGIYAGSAGITSSGPIYGVSAELLGVLQASTINASVYDGLPACSIVIDGTSSTHLNLSSTWASITNTGGTATIVIPTPPSQLVYHAGKNLGLTVSGNTFYVQDDISINSLVATYSITGETLSGTLLTGSTVHGTEVRAGTAGLSVSGTSDLSDVTAKSISVTSGSGSIVANTITGNTLVTGATVHGSTVTGTVISGATYEGLPDTVYPVNGTASTAMSVTGGWATVSFTGTTAVLYIPAPPSPPSPVTYSAGTNLILTGTTFHSYLSVQPAGYTSFSECTQLVSDSNIAITTEAIAGTSFYKGSIALADAVSITRLYATSSITGTTITGTTLTGTRVKGTTYTGINMTVTGYVKGATVNGTTLITGNTLNATRIVKGATISGTTGIFTSGMTAAAVRGGTYFNLPAAKMNLFYGGSTVATEIDTLIIDDLATAVTGTSATIGLSNPLEVQKLVVTSPDTSYGINAFEATPLGIAITTKLIGGATTTYFGIGRTSATADSATCIIKASADCTGSIFSHGIANFDTYRNLPACAIQIDGSSFTCKTLKAGANVTLTGNSNGVCEISATGGSGGGMLYPLWGEETGFSPETEYVTTSPGLILVSSAVRILASGGWCMSKLYIGNAVRMRFEDIIIACGLSGENQSGTVFSGGTRIPVNTGTHFMVNVTGDTNGLHESSIDIAYFIPYVAGGTIEQVS